MANQKTSKGKKTMCIDSEGICKSCAREYDDLPEYSTCPSDDCPSNNEELEETE